MDDVKFYSNPLYLIKKDTSVKKKAVNKIKKKKKEIESDLLSLFLVKDWY